MSVENPMYKPLSIKENQARCLQFEKLLKKEKMGYFKFTNGDGEHFYCLYNVNLIFLKRWCSTCEYNQQSFIFCKDGQCAAFIKDAQGDHHLEPSSVKYLERKDFKEFFKQLSVYFYFSIEQSALDDLASDLLAYEQKLLKKS